MLHSNAPLHTNLPSKAQDKEPLRNVLRFTSTCSGFPRQQRLPSKLLVQEKRSSTQQHVCMCSEGAIVEADVPQPDPASADTFELQVTQRQMSLALPKQSSKTSLRSLGCQKPAAHLQATTYISASAVIKSS